MANGHAGAPEGNQNAVKAKRWNQAIDRALAKRSKGDGIKALDELAEKFLDALEESAQGTEKRGPSFSGFDHLRDTLDGKPAQQVNLAGADGGPLKIEVVKFADDTDSR